MQILKKIIFWIIALILLFLLVFFVVIPVIRYNKNSVTGNEYVNKQRNYLKDLEGVTDTLDDITSLYLSGNIDYEEYQDDLDMVKAEFIIINQKYEQENENLSIKNYSDKQKKAVKAVQESYKLLETLLVCCQNDSADKDVLAYKYLTAQQAIQEQMLIFVETTGG